jgi:acyl-CoA reductase-like NAD-dependent aldehyde dehydrogenase
VTKEYVGAGPIGEAAAGLDAARRAARDRERWQRAAALEAQDALERPTHELDDLADRLAAVALILAGYHRHDRGEWRRRRGRDRAERGPASAN